MLPDPSPEVADLGQEAELLQGPVYLLLSGVEEVHSYTPREKSGNQPQVLNALNDSFCLGSGWRGITFPKRVCSCKAAPKEATEVQGRLRTKAKVLFLLHLGIRAAGRIMKNFPENK